MSINVKSIDEFAILDRLRKSKSKEDKEVLHYIRSLQDAISRQKELTNVAINKLRKEAVKILDSDCTCTGDQYGWVRNPQCIIHGDKR